MSTPSQDRLQRPSRCRVFAASLFALALWGGSATARLDAEQPSPADSEDEARSAKLAQRDALFEEVQRLSAEAWHEEALVKARRMMELEVEIFGPQNVEVAGSLGWIARELSSLDRTAEAIASWRLQAEMYAGLEDDPPWKEAEARRQMTDAGLLLAMTPDERAQLRDAAAKIAAARKLYETDPSQAVESVRDALRVRVSLLGDLHAETANAYFELGYLLYLAERSSEAKPLVENSLAIRREACGDDDPVVAQALDLLAKVEVDLQESSAALAHYAEAARIYLDSEGENSLSAAATLTSAGKVLKNSGEWSAAQDYFEQSLTIRRRAQVRSAKTAEAMLDVGWVIQKRGEYAKALPFYKEAVETFAATLGKQHEQYLDALTDLGSVYSLADEVDEALICYEEVYATSKAKGGESDPRTVDAVRNLAALHLQAKDYARALPLYEKAVQLNRQALGDDHPETLKSQGALGLCLRKSGDYPASVAVLKEVVDRQRRTLGEDHLDTASTMNQLALSLSEGGDYGEAAKYFEKSLSVRRKALGEDDLLTAMSLANYGTVLTEEGQYAAARTVLEQALAVRRKQLGERHVDTADALNKMGYLLSGMGDYSAARRYYQQALEIRKTLLGPEAAETAESINNLGFTAYEAGDYAASQSYLEEALKVRRKALGEENPTTAEAWNNLGFVRKAAGDLAGARECYEKSLTILRKVVGPEHPRTALALTNLGVHLLVNEHEQVKAEEYFRQALSIYRKSLDDLSADLPRAMKNLGAALAVRGDPSAEALFLEAGQLERRSLEMELTTLTDEQMALFEKRLSPTFDLVASLPLKTPQSRRELGKLLLSRKAILFDVLQRRRQALANNAMADEGLVNRRRRLQQIREELEKLATQSSETADLRSIAQRRSRLREEAGAVEGELSRRLAELTGREANLSVDLGALAARLPPEGVLVDFTVYRPVDFRAQVAAPPHYAAVVIGGAEDAGWYDLGPASEIDALIENLAAHIDDFKRARHTPEDESAYEAEYREIAKKLYARLLAPLSPSLKGAKQIYLGPDSRLHEIPFEALVDGSGKYLIETGRQFAYVNSGRDLLREQTGETDRGVFVFAGPNYDLGAEGRFAALQRDSPRDAATLASDATEPQLLAAAAPILRSSDTRLGWRRLPGADLEGEEAAAAFSTGSWGAVRTFTGDDALEDLVKQVDKPRVMIFVTHGDFLEDQPDVAASPDGARSFGELDMDRGFAELRGGAGLARAGLRSTEDPLLRSYLLLAGANKIDEPLPAGSRLDNGWLTAQEIAELDLRGTDLVVLSACNTSRGQADNGQAVTGMRSAFLFAGARTIVGSLYEVPNAETRQLMKPFYEGVAAGRGKLASLNAAKLRLLEERRRTTGAAHPFYWASFVLVGEP